MIKLFPTATSNEHHDTADEGFEPRKAVAAEARPSPGDRPWVYANMIASADGGTAVDGLSGQLGGPADKAMFSALRSVADVIIVGASTARKERYRPAYMSDEIVVERLARGQATYPRLAVVSRSLSLDLDLPLFEDSEHRPYILTAATAPQDKRDELSEVAEVLIAGETGVDLSEALRSLHQAGARIAMSEGGPSINGQLIAADLIDEWNLSLSPRLLGGDSKRAAVGPLPAGPPEAMTLKRVWTEDDLLFCRWVRNTGTRTDTQTGT